MDIFVLDENLEIITVIDTYVSLIWTERYSACGDFELYTFADSNAISNLRKNRYLTIKESNTVMIIEDILLETDVEDGRYITVTGRSLESILDRRIVWGQKILSGRLQDAIRVLLMENVISPSDSDRKIDNFIFEESTDKTILDLVVNDQFTGDIVYDVVKSLCDKNGIGFRMTLNEFNQFVFSLYSGKNRSYSQSENPYVTFSPNFDNIINSSYMESNRSLKNVTLVAGEGEGSARKMTSVGSGSGLHRRELFTDARDISSEVDGGTLSDDEYISQLKQRGSNKLAENVSVESFEGKVDATRMFVYGEDFFIGDIVQIANEYGIEGTARITELIRSHSEDGLDIYPTFNMTE